MHGNGTQAAIILTHFIKNRSRYISQTHSKIRMLYIIFRTPLSTTALTDYFFKEKAGIFKEKAGIPTSLGQFSP